MPSGVDDADRSEIEEERQPAKPVQVLVPLIPVISKLIDRLQMLVEMLIRT